MANQTVNPPGSFIDLNRSVMVLDDNVTDVRQFMRKTKKHNPTQIAMKPSQTPLPTASLLFHFKTTSIR
jgi:hypothetical protein